MNGTKIRLSDFEMDLVQNADWILTKRVIIDKVYDLFGMLAEEYVSLVKKCGDQLPLNISSIPPKISKGENYHGLPYVVLDYPRYFEKENSFAVRSFFWWGNFFSSTFLVKGKYKKQFAEKFYDNYSFLSDYNYSICISEDEWDFRFTENNFTPVNKLGTKEWKDIIFRKNFVKLSVFISLNKWNEMPGLLSGYFKKNMLAAGINFQDDGINL
ncbi:MAG: hypothetical protein ACM3H8_04490 [Sphingobacteriales bacterium]